jgi:hypothetical protein
VFVGLYWGSNLVCEEEPILFGPGEYRPDPTEGITRIEDLPAPKILRRQRNAKRHLCPPCGHRAYCDTPKQRLLHDLGDLRTGRPTDLQITSAPYYCTPCRGSFTTDLTDLAPPNSASTHRVLAIAVRLVGEDGLPYRPARWHLWRDHRVCVPLATMQHGVEAGGKKGRVAPGHGLSRLGPGGLFRRRGRRGMVRWSLLCALRGR